jgi:hypothetical protein
MANRLTTALIAGALALAGLPALALDLPDSGSKNFDPPGDAPSYFSNETAPVSARTADTTEKDWSAVDALAPDRPVRYATHSGHGIAGRHGRYGVLHASARHAGGATGSTAHAPGFTKAAWTGHARNAQPIAAKATGAKHSRSSAAARHRGV